MSYKKYEDFLNLSSKKLINYLSIRGLKITGKKVELVARAFAAMELNLDIICSAEDQYKRLQIDYEHLLQKHGIPDPNGVELEKRFDNLSKWPVVTMGNIFAFILKKKEFNTDYIGKYKDQKAFSYFDSGFVGPIFIYEHYLKPKEKVIFLYCTVTASQALHESKTLWIVIKQGDEKRSDILTGWCSCMAGSYETCNHVIACLYKIEYANTKGWCNPACTETACQWNLGTRKDVEPKRISDLIISKKLGTKSSLSNDCEENRMKNLNNFDPRIISHRTISSNHISNFIRDMQLVNEEAVLFKSIESLSTTNEEHYNYAFVKTIALNVLKAYSQFSETELIQIFIEKLNMSLKTIENVEKATRGQSEVLLWFEIKSGRLTASKHHEVFTKVNTILKAQGSIKPKTTPLVSKIIYYDDVSSASMKWGV
ncbi:uncharacterized protein LOC136095495 [Hydra vulgaris]|uniref:uncharacterized protein LOC136095495 n=1 Tax=Hydra vulgaris TaxID=6087 RepID=UPI0032E9CBAD